MFGRKNMTVNLTELFEVQDELAKSIVSMVAGRMERETLVSAKKKKPADMYAYECCSVVWSTTG